MSLSRYAFVGIPAFIVGVLFACMVMAPPVFPVDQYGYLFRGGSALLALTGLSMVLLAYQRRHLEPTKALVALLGALFPIVMGILGSSPWMPLALELDRQIIDLGAIAVLLLGCGIFLLVAGTSRVPRAYAP